MRVQGDKQLDADRAGLAAFLAERNLHVAPSTDSTHHLAGPGGQLTFDGHWTDLHLDPLDLQEPVSGGIWHATLSEQECAFVYDLCVAGKMVIINPQGPPEFVVPGRTHTPDDLEGMFEDPQIAWVDDAEELAEALGGNFESFLAFRNQVLGH
ncbi:hypothetical protein FB566_2700 [Stackebrandtia endophytica]|uniref:Uncharacterized protein n=2 Tax=Stackebrandtia endophytica TaxID=1496996 RepID=A0A543AX75_9ACTN|nr:hypothetical protein FB566_2700 [Stackebrandtia endophytica]